MCALLQLIDNEPICACESAYGGRYCEMRRFAVDADDDGRGAGSKSRTFLYSSPAAFVYLIVPLFILVLLAFVGVYVRYPRGCRNPFSYGTLIETEAENNCNNFVRFALFSYSCAANAQRRLFRICRWLG